MSLIHYLQSVTIKTITVFLFILCLPACKEKNPSYNGYIDADLTYLSSDSSGRLAQLLVNRGQFVAKNQTLFKLEQTSDNYKISMSMLSNKALIEQKNAIISQIKYAQINYQRTAKMKQQHAASQNDLDVARRDLYVLRDQLSGINLQIKSGQIDTSDKQWQNLHKENHATDPGIIFDTYFTQNEYVQAGQPVVSLITKDHIKAIFYVSENELSQIALNNKVRISSDGKPELAIGHIRYISNIAQYTPPIIYSRENRQTLIFRVEAGIDSPDLNLIHLGQPVSVEVIR